MGPRPQFFFGGDSVEIHSLGSGSSGNAYVIQHKNEAVLLDAGLSGKRIAAGLDHVGVDSRRVKALLITHEHSDHIAGAGIISRRFKIPVYATQGTWQAAGRRLGKLPYQVGVVSPGAKFSLAGLEITPFSVCHDAQDPVNYVFDTGNKRLVVLTDTGCITRAMLKLLATCHAMVLEANHDSEMLDNGPYPWPLKKRVAGKRGHLSNLQAGKVAAWLATQGNLCQAHLGHLSAVNNNPDFALAAVAMHLRGAGLGSEQVYQSLQVLPREGPGPVLRVEG